MASRTVVCLSSLLTLVGCFNPDSGMLEGSTGPEPGTTGDETTPVDPDTTGGATTTSSSSTTEEATTDPPATDSTTTTQSTGPEPDPVCGNGVPEGDEACDDMGESAACNDDCTLATCGDELVNATAGEQCDDGLDNGLTRRCSDVCRVGAGLDGTYGMAWEQLSGTGQSMFGLQSFHYAGQANLHDLSGNFRYDFMADSWTPIAAPLPYMQTLWANGATDADYIWVPRDGVLWRYEPAVDSWQEFASDMPDGSTDLTAAVFDGQGRIWWHVPDTLIGYDPLAGTTLQMPHPNFGDMYETRLGYDPVTNAILFTGFFNATLVVYSLDDQTFTQVTPSPGGFIRDNSCQDRSGHLYVGSNDEPTTMYQYDVLADAFTALPPLPFPHDNNSSCVVSQDGYLYVGDGGGTMARLPLGTP